jgi:hypothetical protein
MALSGSGFQWPRLTTAQRLALPVGLVDAGLTVFDQTLAAPWYWDGTAWVAFGSGGGGGGTYETIYSGATVSPIAATWTVVDGHVNQVGLDVQATTGTTSITTSQGLTLDGAFDLSLIPTLSTWVSRNCTYDEFSPQTCPNLSFVDFYGALPSTVGSTIGTLDLSGCTNALVVKLGGPVQTSITLPPTLQELTIANVAGTLMTFAALDVSGSNIQTFFANSGDFTAGLNLSGCTQLESIVLDGCSFPGLDLTANASLQTFQAGGALVFGPLDFSGLTNLVSVSLNGTSTGNVDMSNSSIQTFGCFVDAAPTIDLTGCNNLVTVQAEGNIGSFDASGSSVQTFGGGGTGTALFDLSGCTALTTFLPTPPTGNSSYDCSGCTSLGFVSFQFVSFVSADFSGCTALTGIAFSYAPTPFTLNLTNCTSLASIQLADGSSGPTEITSLNISGCTSLAAINNVGALGTPDITSLTTVTVTTLPAMISMDLTAGTGAALNVASVNSILVALDANGLTNGAVNMSGGTSAAPTGAGLVAKANLIGKGWFVGTN